MSQFADVGRYGGHILAIRDHFAFEFEARICAQLSLEIGTVHFLTLGAVSYTHPYKKIVDHLDHHFLFGKLTYGISVRSFNANDSQKGHDEDLQQTR